MFSAFKFVAMFSILFLCITLLSGLTSLSNKNAESVISSQIKAMILRQAELCSYISLCTKSNTSQFRTIGTVPCCQECSCESTCVTQGTCCPDFYNDRNNTDLLTPQEKTTHFSRKMKECGKTNFGNLPNDTGYVMITSCPDNYKDDLIRARCESNFDISNFGTVVSRIPVSDTVSGLTYRNNYCEKCNSDENKSSVPWDAWLECDATRRFLFPYYIMRNPLEFAMQIASKRSCRLAFHPKLNNNGNLTGFEVCKVHDVINTCSDTYSDSKYTQLCTHYSWPVKILFGAETYKNYACMLCNGKDFQEKCLRPPVKIHFAASLNVYIEEKDLIQTTVGENSETHAHSYDSPKIDRVFTNEAGFVHCPKGYIYDSKRVRCRHVLCPLYFYIQKGKCVPMFAMMKGIYYSTYLEMLVPDSLRLALQDSIEKSVSSRLYSFLREKVGESNFEFYVWRSQSVPGTVNVTQSYLIVLTLSGNTYGGNYASVLKFVNTFVLRGNIFNISLRIGENIKDETINFRFSTSVYFRNSKPTVPLYLAVSNRGKLDFGKATEIHISQESLCFRLLLHDEEYRRGRAHIRIHETKYVLYEHVFTDYSDNGKILTFICVNKAFHKIPDVSSNIFLQDETVSFQYAPIPNANGQDRDDAISTSSDVPNDANDETFPQRSITATLCTIALIVFIIATRVAMKALLRRDEIRSSIEVNRN